MPDLFARKTIERGSAGNLFVFVVVVLMVAAGASAIDGLVPADAPVSGQEIKIITPTPNQAKKNLQLQTFGYVTLAPTPNSVGDLCQSGGVNDEPEILVTYSPTTGATTTATGQVKVWVTDEGSPFIAPNEQVDKSTGQVTSPGDRTAKAEDGFLYEPALYVAPGKAENGGTPHFPDFIKGNYNNDPPNRGSGTDGAPYDPIPNGKAGNLLDYTAEYVWNVSSLGLAAGSQQVEFVIHDGDHNRGVGCINVTVQ